MVYFFYLCSCLSTQFLYRTAVKATFNVKENIRDNIKNSITLIINITTFSTIFRKVQVAKPHLFLVISYTNYFTILFLFCLQYLQTFTIYSKQQITISSLDYITLSFIIQIISALQLYLQYQNPLYVHNSYLRNYYIAVLVKLHLISLFLYRIFQIYYLIPYTSLISLSRNYQFF